MNLMDLFIKVVFDSSEFENGVKNIQQTAQNMANATAQASNSSAQAAQEAAKQTTQAVEQATQAQAQAAEDAAQVQAESATNAAEAAQEAAKETVEAAENAAQAQSEAAESAAQTQAESAQSGAEAAENAAKDVEKTNENTSQAIIDILTAILKKNEEITQKISEKHETESKKTSEHWQHAGEKIKNALSVAAKVGLGALTAAAAGISALVKSSVDKYGEYEQLVGGVETLFGTASDTVVENAKKAFKTAQMSANDYMELATSFSATLIQGLTKKTNEATQKSVEAMQTALNKEYEALQKAQSQQLRQYQYSIQDKNEEIQKGFAAEQEALQESQQKQREELEKSHEKQIELYNQATSKKIELINKEYLESLKIINKEEYDRLKAIDNEIKKIEDAEKAEAEVEKQKTIDQKRGALERAVLLANSDEARKKAQKELDRFNAEQAKAQAKEERSQRKEDLKNQKDDIKTAAEEKRKEAEKQYSAETQKVKDEYDKQLAVVQESYKQQTEALQKQQAAEQKALQESQSQKMKIIQRQQQEELDAYRENQAKQLEILKETNAKKLKAAQKTAEEAAKMDVTPEIQQRAAEATEIAIQDMADNANKMGTSIGMIQNAYNGFARQNYTMLDNLKLGYSGTASEMARLINDSGILGDSVKVTAETVKDVPFDKVIQAVHKIQQNLKITGTSTAESAKTIQGTLNATKAAWNNLITAMANPDADLAKYINDLITTIVGENEGEGLINRILPAVESALTGVGTLIEKLVPVILDRVPKLLDDNLPKLLNSAIGILDSIVNSLTTNADKIGVFVTELIIKLSTWITNSLPSVIKAGMTILSELVKGLAKAMPELIPAVINCIYLIADTLTDPENLGNIIMAALDIVLAIVDGVVNNIDKIIDVALVVIENITNTLLKPDVLTKLYTAGTKILLKVLEGIIKATPEIIKAILQLTVDMVDSIFKTDWWSIGTNIVNGLWDGIVSVWNNLTNWWSSSWDDLINGVKNSLGIHSPSRVFANIGKNMALGVEEGWSKEYEGIRKDIENGMDFDANIDSNFSTRNSSGTVTGINPIALTLNIDNFNNYTDKDIDTLADTLMYIINEKTIRQGAAYA